MSNQILFVDDDPALLNTMKRNLSLDYKVEIAEGAELALQAIDSHGDFSVVVVDMQMPKFSGIETIAMLRERMPQAIFIMLTGNQDQTTVINAVNQGRVFQFLNKPCQVSEISAVIKAAQQEHNKQSIEKQLLSSTLAGALNLMTDLIELPDNRQIDTVRMVTAIEQLAEKMSIEIGWEEKIAGRIFLVGLSVLSAEEAESFEKLDPTTAEHQAIFNKLCLKSSAMIRKIPRLGWIVELLKAVPNAERIQSSSDRREVAAVLLRVAFYWNSLTLRGHSAESATSIIFKIMPGLGDPLMQAMHLLNDNKDAHVLSTMLASDLREGMIPHRDIARTNGDTIARAGKPLAAKVVENLRNLPEFSDVKFAVIGNSNV